MPLLGLGSGVHGSLPLGRGRRWGSWRLGICDLLCGGRQTAEELLQLLVSHAAAIVGNRNLHVVLAFGRADGHSAPFGSVLACVVGYGVEHEYRQYAVGFHHSRGRFDVERYALESESHASALDDVEHLTQRKALYVELQAPLPQLYPLGEHIVIDIYHVGKVGNILHSLGPELAVLLFMQQRAHLVEHPVDKGHHLIGH